MSLSVLCESAERLTLPLPTLDTIKVALKSMSAGFRCGTAVTWWSERCLTRRVMSVTAP